MGAPFDWSARYDSVRTPLFARNVVATSQPLAAQAGLRMLLGGGNAVDAAIATAAALTIVEPVSCGLGSDAFAIVWDGAALHGLNASGPAPAAWDVAYFRRRHGDAVPMRGWDSVTVPGAVAGWAALHAKFGRLPFDALFGPAVELAERGFAVTPVVQRKWAAQAPQLQEFPGFAQAFLPRGRVPQVGERFVFADAARTLRRVAQSLGRDFYEGETAEALVAHAKAHGGAMTLADLRGFAPAWCGTIAKDYRGYTLHEIPPNGQGIAALMALGILSHFDLASLEADSADCRHLQIEAMKAAFADVYRWVGDPRSMTGVSAAQLLDDGYLAQRAARIRLDRASEFDHGLPPAGGTIYLSAADERGMMVSFIQSNYMGFGSGVVVPGVGVSLQNRGRGFTLQAGHPNCVAPGKQPFHTIVPAFLTKDGRPQMSFGVMGGNMQPQGHVQALSRMIDHRQHPQAACDAPRWKVGHGLSLDVEPTMPSAVVDELRRRGHRIEAMADSYMDFGAGQFVWRLGDDASRDADRDGGDCDGYVAASDPRRDGAAVGY
ncbi:MAG: gamma-glutamyltransferase family protein [Burkholderiaceae bacterium]|nr:gamma-glutamyltransferase family protein [Burkholderiaceae bacterium]